MFSSETQRRCLVSRTKKDNKNIKKIPVQKKCRRIGNHLHIGGIEDRNYLQQQVVTGGATENTSIQPFSVYFGLSGSRFSKAAQQSFSTSSSSSLGIPRGSQGRQGYVQCALSLPQVFSQLDMTEHTSTKRHS